MILIENLEGMRNEMGSGARMGDGDGEAILTLASLRGHLYL